MTNHLDRVTTLTFDIFGTVLDLEGSLVGPIDQFLSGRETALDAKGLWVEWRARQRLEQFQDSLLMLGHSGYLETCRLALMHVLRKNGVEHDDAEVEGLMNEFSQLRPFEDAVEGLGRLKHRYRLVALSNGDSELLESLVAERIGVDFDDVISVDEVGVFKPHPAVYRMAARRLEVEPLELMMVAAHAFDILGARACGYRAAYVDRYGLPTEESHWQPDITVRDFRELADVLLGEPAAPA